MFILTEALLAQRAVAPLPALEVTGLPLATVRRTEQAAGAAHLEHRLMVGMVEMAARPVVAVEAVALLILGRLLGLVALAGLVWQSFARGEYAAINTHI